MKVVFEKHFNEQDITSTLSNIASKNFDKEKFSLDIDQIFTRTRKDLTICSRLVDKYALSDSLLENTKSELSKITESTRLRTLSIEPTFTINDFDATSVGVIDYKHEFSFRMSSLTIESFIQMIKPDILKLSEMQIKLAVVEENLNKLEKLYTSFTLLCERIEKLHENLKITQKEDDKERIEIDLVELNTKLAMKDKDIDDIKKKILETTSSSTTGRSLEQSNELDSISKIVKKDFKLSLEIFDERANEKRLKEEARKKQLKHLATVLIVGVLFSLGHFYQENKNRNYEKKITKAIKNPLLMTLLGEEEIKSLKRANSVKAFKNKIRLHGEKNKKVLTDKVQAEIRRRSIFINTYSDNQRSMTISLDKKIAKTLKKEYGILELSLSSRFKKFPEGVSQNKDEIFIKDVCAHEVLKTNLNVVIDFGFDVKLKFSIVHNFSLFKNTKAALSICK